MTGSVASASNRASGNLLVIAPNWLGDGIMAMPGLQALHASLPSESTITVAARGGQVAMWEMHPDVSRVLPLPKEAGGLLKLARTLKGEFESAVIIPNSFRSALLPRLTGIPQRRGTKGQAGRSTLINQSVDLTDLQQRHQQWEVARLLLGSDLPETLPAPTLTVPPEILGDIQKRLADLSGPILSLIPGAARGPSKQWPAERFQAVAARWVQETDGGVLWLGTPDDRSLSELLNTTLGNSGLVLAGSTSLKQFAAAIACSDAVVANDSGGMHLAAALGTPVTAIFGITDPTRTGPLSEQATVIQHSAIRNRSVPTDSPEARTALAAVTVDEVAEAVLAFPRDHR